MRRILALTVTLFAASCSDGGGNGDRAEIYLQRFFGECGAQYGGATDVSKVEGECGIITTMINKFNAQNPDVRVSSNVVAWPGYPQLSAQMAAKDPPDLVTMHTGVISDYAAEGLLEPVEPYLKEAGLSPSALTEASRSAVTIGDKLYGLPFDTHGGLFHINTKLFAQAGLMKDGKPVLPEEIAEARTEAGHKGRCTAASNRLQRRGKGVDWDAPGAHDIGPEEPVSSDPYAGLPDDSDV